MICPTCQTEFKGGSFTTSNGPGTSKRMRECPRGHRFEEPPRQRKPDKKDRRIAELESALQFSRDGFAIHAPQCIAYIARIDSVITPSTWGPNAPR
jgi:hypothetical protein